MKTTGAFQAAVRYGVLFLLCIAVWSPAQENVKPELLTPVQERMQQEIEHELDMLARALVLYQREFGRAASDLSDLVLQNYVDPSSCVDPWDRSYRYSPGSGSAFSLVCLGSDGRPGGRGRAADVPGPAPRRPPGTLIPPNAYLLVSAVAMVAAVMIPAGVIVRHGRAVARRRRAWIGAYMYRP